MREAGDLGLLGMHLQGYGCAGANAVSYGLATWNLKRGFRHAGGVVSCRVPLRCSRSGSLGARQKTTWLPRMATGEAVGCFGLTEADFGSNPRACGLAPSGTTTTG